MSWCKYIKTIIFTYKMGHDSPLRQRIINIGTRPLLKRGLSVQVRFTLMYWSPEREEEEPEMIVCPHVWVLLP